MGADERSIDSVLERPEMGSYRWVLYALCGLLMGLEGYDAYIVANLAPFIARGLNISIPSMGFVFTAQAAGMAVGFYTISMLADRLGRRNIILIGSTLFGLLTLASTMAGHLEQFVIVRFLAFGALGGTIPNIVALLAEFMPEARRPRLLTWIFIAHGLGASAAGLFGPSFVQYHSWEAAFWAGGVLLLLFVPLLWLRLPESCRFLLIRNPSDPRIGEILRRIDPGFSFTPSTRFTTTEVKAEGLPLAGLFRDGRAPMTLLLWLAMGSALCATATISAWKPSFLHVLGGLETATATRMSAVSAFGAMVGPVMLTLLMKRIGVPLALALTLILGFVAMTMLALVAQINALGWVLSFAFGLLVIGAQAGLNSLAASSYPTSMRSTGIGWAGGIGRITSMIGPGLGGAMLAAGWGAWTIYTAIASPLVVAAVAMLLFYRLKAGTARRAPATAPA
ncbi:MFS transporter [Sphingobium lignivorans]|uniref:AAHS family 4-hydroxybenzoate transporter-like MFS transporter n=1 Tax=Sphingobium lignivorans TaxID=2735886 RepID=A0ABR6NJT7_9SPHN|nr:MFS transporter [Sphingobium lignivorans]MBB5987530.1 AAHS family 4-hydroxybenzoate transporter-like MFS transporter [Sphingobium lignivorans]